jgi:hypothetical protein
LLASDSRVSGRTVQPAWRALTIDWSCVPMRTVLTVCAPVLASINGSITTERGSFPSRTLASASNWAPARLMEFSNGTGTGATNVLMSSVLVAAAGEPAIGWVLRAGTASFGGDCADGAAEVATGAALTGDVGGGGALLQPIKDIRHIPMTRRTRWEGLLIIRFSVWSTRWYISEETPDRAKQCCTPSTWSVCL